MEAAHNAGRQSGPPADPATAGRSRGEAALVAGLIFLLAAGVLSILMFGILTVAGMLREGTDEYNAWPSWSALALLVLVPPFGLWATALVASGALAIGAVLAATAAALLRWVPFWAFLAMAVPCLAVSHLQFTWAINTTWWGPPTYWTEPKSPGFLPLWVLPPLFGAWLLLRRALPPHAAPARASDGNAGDA